MANSKSGLFSRWQQRLTKVKEEEQAQQIAEQEAQEQQKQQLAQAEAESVETEDAEAQQQQELPDPESIEEGGSFADFLKEGVDPTKKKQALRALWSQPQYNITDGMAEYALDYSNQPKLTAQAAKEVAKQVFRHLDAKLEEERKQQEAEQLRLAQQQQAEGQNDPAADAEPPAIEPSDSEEQGDTRQS
ncbi:DUF3306 domain-containing protein [Ferrimonas aestuarii]|uniref:DUF3306 domain-containing protein n=1 Tax=Ferrimonas aestuarii TaxID=2569539 RepID=A0A4U1BMU5_9GAMM|nr:DUF3306 domain-containing protein [Ferrimonas aestuarii]TKB54999.1 DUF3306 domain-containing protein [Ferrimonas aestuarii]